MQQITIQDADIINTGTPAVTAYPSTDKSSALLIWQPPCLDDKIPKAVGISVSGRHTVPLSTNKGTHISDSIPNGSDFISNGSNLIRFGHATG